MPTDPTAPEMVKVELAHHLPEGNPFVKDGKKAKPGDKIEVTRAQGEQLLNGGYLTVDPYDREAAKAALGPGPAAASAARAASSTPAADGS